MLAGSEGGREGGAGDLETKEETKGRGGWEGPRLGGLGRGAGGCLEGRGMVLVGLGVGGA